MSYTAEQLSEREFALREAAVNDAEERYFKARPIDDGAMQRKAFRAGFDRAWDAKERELADARAERNAAIARSMSNAMEAQAHEDRARMAEAECERLRDALQVCLSYWLSDANPDELQGSVAHMKHISGFAAAIDAALARNP